MDDLMKAAWLQQVVALIKLVGPWLTGGLAGAILTYLLNQRSARRKQPRLILSTVRVDYSIPSKDEQLKDLQVSYGGKSYENLMLFQVDVENVSGRTIGKSPILFILNEKSLIIDRSSVVKPLNREALWLQQDGQEGAYIWDAGELKPGDSARLRLLLTPQAEIKWSWRGEDEVELVSYGRESENTLEAELRNAIAWVAIYLLCGFIPFFSEVLRSLFLVMSSPFIIRYLLRWWSIFSQRKRSLGYPGPIVIADSTSEVAVTTDPLGKATISVIPSIAAIKDESEGSELQKSGQ